MGRSRDLSEVATAFDAGSLGYRNKIINGGMTIDQRNAGASVTLGSGGTFTLDRMRFYSNDASKLSTQQSTDVPSGQGFVNSMLITSLASTTPASTDYYFLEQRLEGYNVYDFNWGTSGAKTVTLSFWVKSSLTGQFGGSVAAGTPTDNSYPFSYTISSANTWEKKEITISGPTSGTGFLTNNGIGLRCRFLNLGSGSSRLGTAGSWISADYYGSTGDVNLIGTSGATFYITGVQLEVGETATPFEHRPYGTELVLCQRYYEKSYIYANVPGTGGVPVGFIASMNNGVVTNTTPGATFKVTKRTAPTVTIYNGVNGTSGQAYIESNGVSIGVTVQYPAENSFSRLAPSSAKEDQYLFHYTASAEL